MNYIHKLGLKISSSSFNKCYIDIGKIKPGQDLLAIFKNELDFPEFKNYKSKFSSTDVSNSQVIRYIVCFYDNNSPFSPLAWEERKLASAEYVGFTRNEDGGFAEPVQKILNCEEEVIRAMVIRYCRIVKGPEYATYKILEWNYNTKSLMATNIKLKDIEQDLTALRTYRDIFLGGDPSSQLRDYFYAIVSEEEKELLKLRPEYQQRHWEKDITKVRFEVEEETSEETK